VKNYPLAKVCGLNLGDNFEKRDFFECDICK